MKFILWLGFTEGFSLNYLPQKAQKEVIYGMDNRKDFYEIKDPYWEKISLSSALVIKKSDLTKKGKNSYTFSSQNLKEEYNLCSSERFIEQNTSGFCSSILIEKDILLTAGHCINDDKTCSETSFIFDYHLKSTSHLPTEASSNNVYHCKEVIVSMNGEEPGNDFALIRLDRSVPDRDPVKFRNHGFIEKGEALVMAGYPLGLPLKFTNSARVNLIAPTYFRAKLDAFESNSGSGVFNSKTGLLEGILTLGESDFVQSGNCKVSHICFKNSCPGEVVTPISQILPYWHLTQSELDDAI